VNLCTACGLDFASVRGFDRHRVGVHAYTHEEGLRRDQSVGNGRRCLNQLELQERGFAVDQRGRWTIAAEAEQARLRFAGVRQEPRERAEA
jgi:hypothetical protein